MEELLASLPLFTDLQPAERSALAGRLVERAAARGELIFSEGDQGDTVYLILTGKIKIIRTALDGRENLLAVLGPGEVFGELSLFDPGPRTASARALEDTALAALSHANLDAWLRTEPQVGALLLKVLARRLRRTNDAMADLVFTDVAGRVAKALLALADRFGTAGNGADEGAGVFVDHGLTQEELAQLVGASRETVNKALADFVARGWIELRSRGVVVLEADRLRHRAR
ncbi:MAG: Crp/Fnr family transcriptional regulator [Mycobacteriales bacterium]